MSSIDLRKWMIEYEREYDDFIIYYHRGKEKKECSPRFEGISNVLRERGYLLKKEFVNICKWKTPRQIPNYMKNSEEEIRKRTSNVIELHPNTEAQLRELTHLIGVGVPVASAILTVIFPEEYCVVDYRAWKALLWVTNALSEVSRYPDFSNLLENFRDYGSIRSYVRFYLPKIRELAKEYGMTPREVEMALWMYDKKRGRIQSHRNPY